MSAWKSMRVKARTAITDVMLLESELGEIIADLPPIPKQAASVLQLQTAANHMRAALRLVQEAHARECPLQLDEDWSVAARIDEA